MTKQVKILKEVLNHDGYIKVKQYQLEVPSLSAKKESILISQREIALTRDSVSMLLYIPHRDQFMFCKQFRMGVFLSCNRDDYFTLECVAGTIDKGENPKDAARREI